MSKAIVVGLTGGIGSGKSAATDAFAQLGIDIIDADQVARDVVAKGSDGLAQIAAHFGPNILLVSGELDRAALREHVFQHEEEKQWLNNLLHPMIRTRMLALIASSTSGYCILSVPLLIENNMTAMCKRVIVVDCPESMQLARAMARDGSSKQTITSIMASQANRETRLAAADDVLNNTGSLDDLHKQVSALHQHYLEIFSLSE